MPSNQNGREDLYLVFRERLFTAVVGDVLDSNGFTNQFLPEYLRPLDSSMVVIGRAFTVLEADCTGTEIASLNEERPFGLMLEALDSLKPFDVYICTGSREAYALWGENMTTRAMRLGAAGAVLDGFVRDVRGILRRGFPVFSRGAYARDQRIRGRVIDYGCKIMFPNGAIVHPGDIIFGDVDGVVVIPQDVLEDVFRLALEKINQESLVRKALENGMPVSEVFQKHGLL